MKRWIFAAAAVAALAGCGPDDPDTPATDDDATSSYSPDPSDGTATAEIETDEGAATVRRGVDVPVSLPRGFSIYPGAKIVTNTVFDQDDEKGALVTIEAEAEAADMIAFYRKQAEAAGIAISLDLDTDKMAMIGGKAPDGSPFSFTATKAGGALSTGQLMVGGTFGE